MKFGFIGVHILVERLQEICNKGSLQMNPSKRKEGRRTYFLTNRRNRAARYLLCSARDEDSKCHVLVFPEGKF